MAMNSSSAPHAQGGPLTASSQYAMSVDVEDFFQVWAFSDVIARSSWDGFSLRVGDTTRDCLDLFDEHGAKATFFTLGWVAERDKPLIREIVARGHELASHGYDHTKVNTQTADEFRLDAGKTKSLLEDISGQAIRGYRAAGFSIDQTTPWAHDVLAEIGYAYSSSSHPIAHDHYGDATAPQSPYFPCEGASFMEAPVATTQFAGRRVSCAGGGWFRVLPYGFSHQLMKKASRSLSGPVIFYFHPWEIDPEQPRIERASGRARLRHYINLSRMRSKLARLLDQYPWTRIDDALGLSEVGAA